MFSFKGEELEKSSQKIGALIQNTNAWGILFFIMKTLPWNNRTIFLKETNKYNLLVKYIEIIKNNTIIIVKNTWRL
jgi:hypothetical protein